MLKIHSLKENLNRSEIVELVNKHRMTLPKYHKLKDMYENRNAIHHRVQNDESKPTIRLAIHTQTILSIVLLVTLWVSLLHIRSRMKR